MRYNILQLFILRCILMLTQIRLQCLNDKRLIQVIKLRLTNRYVNTLILTYTQTYPNQIITFWMIHRETVNSKPRSLRIKPYDIIDCIHFFQISQQILFRIHDSVITSLHPRNIFFQCDIIQRLNLYNTRCLTHSLSITRYVIDSFKFSHLDRFTTLD